MPTAVVSQYLSVHLDMLIEMYLGYCTSRYRNIAVLDVDGTLEAGNDNDATSSN